MKNYFPNEFVRRRSSNRKTANVVNRALRGSELQSLPSETDALLWMERQLKWMTEATSDYRQALCDMTGVSMPELRDAIEKQRERVARAKSPEERWKSRTDFWDGIKRDAVASK